MAIANIPFQTFNANTTGWNATGGDLVAALANQNAQVIARNNVTCLLKLKLGSTTALLPETSIITSFELVYAASVPKLPSIFTIGLDNLVDATSYPTQLQVVSQLHFQGPGVFNTHNHTRQPNLSPITRNSLEALQVVLTPESPQSDPPFTWMSLYYMHIAVSYHLPEHKTITLDQGRINLTSGKITIEN